MVFVYSSKKTDIKGVHCNPKYFCSVNTNASLIYTDNEKIKKAYEFAGIKVKAIAGDVDTDGNVKHWAYPKELLTEKGKLSTRKKAEIKLFNEKFADEIKQGTILNDKEWSELYPNEDIELFRITEEVI